MTEEKEKQPPPPPPIQWPANDMIKENDASKSDKWIKRGEKQKDD
jgi:hypothetical protein